MSKPRSVKPCKRSAGQLILRMVGLKPETADEATKSVEVVIASENPVERYDESSGQSYNEILLMDGVEFRTDRFRLPIVDSHDRSTVRNVLGSVRDIHVEGSELIGTASFARDRDSQDAFDKLMDGHLTDFSITATPNSSRMVSRGESELIGEQQITGPAEIVTRWTPTDASLVAAGADETSTVRELRRAYQIPEGVEAMDEELKASLIEMGMPEDIENAADALRWRMDFETPDIEKMDDEEEPAVEDIEKMDDEEKPAATERSLDKTSIERKLLSRNREISAICRKADIEREVEDKFLNDPEMTLESVRLNVLERMMARKPLGTSAGGERIEVTASSDDKFEAAARDGLIARAMQGVSRKDPFAGSKPAAGFQDFQGIGLRRLSEEILRRGGLPVNRMTAKDIAMVAMGHKPTINRMRHNGIMRDEAYHTTGLLPNLMLDAANKTLLAGYDEAPFTWDIWARQGTSVADFKAINRIRYSESPDLEMVPEGKDYPEGATSDSKESYQVEKFGKMFTVTWETVVNDDMDAISRVPQMHGNAARRTQNKKVYQVLTDNAAMADGNALFDASTHSNQSGSGAAPSVATLNAMFTAMRTQTGLEGEIIGVMPRYLIVPASLEATALELFSSTGRPDVGGDTTGNSGVQNIYGPGGRRSVEVVAEPQLDGNSTTAWYGAADNGNIDTVELTFLQGEESPVLENEWDFEKDVYKYKIRQTFGTKAIDWRGLYKNAGA